MTPLDGTQTTVGPNLAPDLAPDLALRREGAGAYDLQATSTAGHAIELNLWGRPLRVYANANLSVYTRQKCNAKCGFCVEELRPLSRGTSLAAQTSVMTDTDRWLGRLDTSLAALQQLRPSVSITGGEPSRDPALPEILGLLHKHNIRKRTITTNGSGLWLQREGKAVVQHLIDGGLQHLNISRAHVDAGRNNRLMAMHGAVADGGGLSDTELRRAICLAREAGMDVRLSAVLLRDGVRDLSCVDDYLRFAASVGCHHVIFRQLMHHDPATTAPTGVARYNGRQRVAMRPILRQLDRLKRFAFVRQVVGYYYYVEVWRTEIAATPVTVTFEGADLGTLERAKQRDRGLVHELVFHPSGDLATTWQPWDGILGPPTPR